MRILIRMAAVALGLIVVLLFTVGCVQRRLLYFPSHQDTTMACAEAGLSRWLISGEFTGYARVVNAPKKIWFCLHGNGGQAGNRGYLVSRVGSDDAIFILEYPGYGERTGSPSKRAFDQAALKAYNWIVQQYGVERVVVLGESLGSGPACELAQAPIPPPHLVLVVPFDVLKDVAQEKFSYLPVSLIMLDRWNNVAALKKYAGKLDIFGATHDQVIPVQHARNLAASCPAAHYHEFDGNHNWSASPEIDLTAL